MGVYQVETEDGGVYEITTEDLAPSSQPVIANERPSWGESAQYVGRSLLEGAGGTVDTALQSILPAKFLMEAVGQKSPIESLAQTIFGRSEDVGVGGPVAEVARAAVKGSVAPIGGPIANAITSAGGETAAQVFPDSPIAPIAGSLLTSAGLSGASSLAKGATNAAKKLDRASVGAGIRDFARSLKTKGLIDADDAGDIKTRLSQAIDEIAETEGLGVNRSAEALLVKNENALREMGPKISGILNSTDEAGVTVSGSSFLSPQSATQQTLNNATASRKDMEDALSEFMDRFTDPINGWDGTVTGLNKWKSDIAKMAFSGSAKGPEGAAAARKIQRAIQKDLGTEVNEAVAKSGVIEPTTWAQLMRRYSNHKELQPVLEHGVVSGQASTAEKGLRGAIKTTGGVLTTPTVMGGIIGGGLGGIGGLAAGAALGAAGTPTGRGLTASALRGAGKATSTVTKGAAGSALYTLEPREIDAVKGLFSKEQEKQKEEPAQKGTVKELFGRASKDEVMPPMDEGMGQKQNISYTPDPELAPLVEAIIQQESGGDAQAVGYETPETKRLGERAQGLMQIMPSTAKEIARDLGIEEYDLKDPATNRLFGEFYLKKLLNQFNGDEELALTAYHSGPGTISKLLRMTKGETLDDIIKYLGPVGQKYAREVKNRLNQNMTIEV